jgi:hypothetical protein
MTELTKPGSNLKNKLQTFNRNGRDESRNDRTRSLPISVHDIKTNVLASFTTPRISTNRSFDPSMFGT